MQVIKYMFQQHGDDREHLISLEEFDNFSDDAVRMVPVLEIYMEKDYIRNYDGFLKFVEEKKIVNSLSKQAGESR